MFARFFGKLLLIVGLVGVLAGCGAVRPSAVISNAASVSTEVTVTPLAMAATDVAPDAAVQAFYEWYLEYAGGGTEPRNPLADGAYRTGQHLSEALVTKVDEIVASFDKGGYDPFLCAQDVPTEFSVESAQLEAESATFRVRTSLNPEPITVQVAMVDGQWMLTDITCAAAIGSQTEPATPEEVVEAFYGWYLDYSEVDPVTGAGHNAMVDKAYRQSPYLTQELKTRIDEILASFTMGGYDPFLCAQDVPESINVGPAEVNGDRASTVVRTSFFDHWLTVYLVRTEGQWRIEGINCKFDSAGGAPMQAEGEAPSSAALDEAASAGWQLHEDTDYGFEIQYPETWALRPVELGTVPEDIPLKRATGLYPTEGPEGMIPVSLEVYEGSEETFWSAFPGTSPATEIEVAGLPALRVGPEPGMGSLFTILSHPTDDQVRVVFRYETDMSVAIRGLDDTVQQMLETFAFVGS